VAADGAAADGAAVGGDPAGRLALILA